MMALALEVLRLMIELEEAGHEPDLVREGRAVWLGCERLANRTLDSLVMHCAVTPFELSKSVERFEVNATGRAIARRYGRRATYREIADMSHFIFGEPGEARVTDIMLDWLESTAA